MTVDETPFTPDAVIADILHGDIDQYRVLVRQYGPLVRGYLGGGMSRKTDEDVEDLAQRVFLIAFKKLKDYRPGSSFSSWLLGIARFELNNRLRKVKRRDKAMERYRDELAVAIGTAQLPPQTQQVSDRVEALRNCIEKLPKRSRDVVRGALDGAGINELAADLNLSPNAIYQARHRAYQALRLCMETTSKETPE